METTRNDQIKNEINEMSLNSMEHNRLRLGDLARNTMRK